MDDKRSTYVDQELHVLVEHAIKTDSFSEIAAVHTLATLQIESGLLRTVYIYVEGFVEAGCPD